jgi:hypothetical protein
MPILRRTALHQINSLLPVALSIAICLWKFACLFLYRYKSGDFTGQLLTQCLELLKIQETNNVPLYGGATTATGNRITPGSETHDKDERVNILELRQTSSKGFAMEFRFRLISRDILTKCGLRTKLYKSFTAITRSLTSNKSLYSQVSIVKMRHSRQLGPVHMSRAAVSQVARSRLVYCFYMFLRFDSHENRAGPVCRAPVWARRDVAFPGSYEHT